MDIQGIRNHLTSTDTEDVLSLKIYFVNKRRNGLTAYIPNVNIEVRRELIEMYKGTFDKSLFDLEQVEYNELGSTEDTLEVSDLNIGNMNLTLANILEQSNQTQDLEDMDVDKINYYVIEINNNDQKLYIFKRFNKQKNLRSGFKGMLSGNDFKKLESESIVGINSEIDLLIFDNQLLIVNRLSIQFISDLRDYYISRANAAMQDIDFYNKIMNFEAFKNDCISDGRLIKRVTKIANTPSMVPDFFAKYDRLENVVDAASLTIQLDDNKKIIYSGAKEEREDILKCIADALYQTLLQESIGEDKLK